MPKSIVRKWVGHVAPEIWKLYAHVADDIPKDAMDRLSAGAPAGEDGEDEGQQPAAVAS
jgi:hypothetical protein